MNPTHVTLTLPGHVVVQDLAEALATIGLRLSGRRLEDGSHEVVEIPPVVRAYSNKEQESL